jgi:hypothetical protein
MVDAGYAVARMQQPFRQSPVVRQQHQTGALQVETPDGIHPLAHVRDQIRYRRPALWIAERRHDTARLVECDRLWRAAPDALAVDRDLVLRRIGPTAELANDGAIDADPPISDQRFGGAPRRDPRRAQNLLQSVGQSRSAPLVLRFVPMTGRGHHAARRER